MGYSISNPKSSNNWDCISKALGLILQNEGMDILNNSKKVKALLSDLCAGDFKREILIIERLLEDHVHDNLLRQKETTPFEILRTNVIKRICANHPLNETLVGSGTDTLAIALGIIHEPIPSRHSHTNTSYNQDNIVSPKTSVLKDNDSLISQAIKFNQSKSFQNALPLLTKILENEPENAIALREKGFAISNLLRYEEAIRWYDKSLANNPNDSITWTYKGYALSKIGRSRDSIKCYDMAIQIDPMYAAAWRSKGYSLVKIHDDRGAMACY